jgi:hypothetical protein
MMTTKSIHPLRKSLGMAALLAVLLVLLVSQAALADVAYASQQTASLGSNGTSLVINVPSGTAAGDLLLATISTDGSTSFSTPTGWTLLNQDSNGTDITLAVFYRVADGTEPTNYTFNWTGSEQAAGAILRYTGVDTTTPIDVWDAANSNDNAPTAPSVNTTVADTMVVRIYGADDDDLAGSPYPPGHTGRLNIRSNTGWNNTCSLGVADVAQAAAGATGTAAFAMSASEQWRAMTLALRPAVAAETISGVVFRDFNADGTRDTREPGVAGVAVTAYDAAGTAVVSATTDSTGAYTLTGLSDGTQYRLEVTGLPGYLQPGPVGADCNTTVVFVTSPAMEADVGLTSPGEYCESDPDLITPVHINGDPLGGGTAGIGGVLRSFPYSSDATSGIPITVAIGSQIGSTYGVAYQRSSDKVFVSALARRHTGFGPLGSGGIYVIDYNHASPGSSTVSTFIDISATLGIDTGSITRSSSDGSALPANGLTPNHDQHAFDAVGKTSLGDMDISEDEETLWVVNLYDRTLYELEIGVPATPPSTYVAHNINAWVVDNMPCTDGEYRPWGLKVHDGLVYVGGVCSAESTGGSASDLVAYVLAHDPDGADGNFTSVFTFSLAYDRGIISHDGTYNPPAEWRPWIDAWSDMNNPTPPGPWGKQVMHPQPILADIEFDDDGAMIIGLLDRGGLQVGDMNYSTNTGSTATYEGVAAGDILRACKSGSTWVLESNGSCGGTTTGGANNNEGPGGGEFYYQDSYGTTHDETAAGALALLPGTGEVALTSWDPTTHVRSGGVNWFSSSDGTDLRGYEVYGQDEGGPSGANGNPYTFGKAAGVGDLEALCSAAPIEIGNRVWEDTDGDGIQDPGESPIANVTIELYDSSGSLVATTSTDSNGNWYFDTGDGLSANTQYFVVIAEAEFLSSGDLYGYSLTSFNSSALLRDSDAMGIAPVALGDQVVGVPYTTGDAGHNDHTLDFGFAAHVSLGNLVWSDQDNDGQYDAPVRVGDYVWYDLNGNDLQDEGEPGVADVSVTLYDNATSRELAATTTDPSGKYLFDNLSPGDYYVIFDLSTIPAGFTVVTPNAGGDSIDSDANVTTGQTAATGALTAGQQDLTLDMGLEPSSGVVAVGDRVWYDIDRNGDQDTNEPGVPGVRVELHPGTATDCSAEPLVTEVTDVQGYYVFVGLAPGSYRVCFDLDTLPSGYGVTDANQTSDDLDSDADANGLTPATSSLTSGQVDRSLDMGIRATNATTNSLGNYVWYDQDGGGDQDSSEPGVSGVKVELHPDGASCDDMPLAVDVTDEFGAYLFSGLPDGSYFVCFDLDTIPDGYERTTYGGSTATGSTDSDADADGKTPSVSLSGGVSNLGLDMGILLSDSGTVAVGDRVWLDADRDGIQDAGEPGVPNIRVELYENGETCGTDVPTAVDSTDDGGYYLFDGLPTGNYFVCFDRDSLPAGFEVTTQDADGGGDGPVDSDANTSTGATSSTGSLSAGTTYLTLDMGIRSTNSSPASLGDYVWYDRDHDGTQDAGEAGVEGVRVTLYNATTNRALASTTTDSAGLYLFSGLQPGSYYVIFDLDTLPLGYSVTTYGGSTATGSTDSDASTATGQTPSVTLSAGSSNLGLDMGVVLAGDVRVGDRVWYDLDADGRQEEGETGVPGVTVYLHDATVSETCDDMPLGSTVTNLDGDYLFGHLAPGSYYVCFDLGTIPDGYSVSPPNTQLDDGVDSDADTTTGKTAPTGSLAAGEYDLTLDMGVYSTGNVSVGDYVWYDHDRDGIQDAGEGGVPGVTVELYQDGQTCKRDMPLAVTTTSADGSYLFGELPAGNYFVCFDLDTLPSGYEVALQNQGGDDALDSDADQTTGATASAGALSAGQSNLTLDMGIRQAATGTVAVGDRVWYDDDRDGVQDAGEAGVPGIDVTLRATGAGDCSTAPVLAADTTDSDGLYLFDGLAAGSYFVCFDLTDLPGGYIVTQRDLGGDDGADSDADQATGQTASTPSLTAGQVDRSLDMGIFVPDHELPLAGVTVYLYAETTTCAVDGSGAVAVTTTGEDGKYLFAGLTPGSYYIYIPASDFGSGGVLQYMVTSPGAPDPDDDTDDDDNGATGGGACSGGITSDPVTLGIAQEPTADGSDDPNTPDVSHNLTVDAGLLEPVALGNLVWYDLNGDGDADSGEPGVSGVTVELYRDVDGDGTCEPGGDDGSAIASETTDSNGHYEFLTLTAADYCVHIPSSQFGSGQALGADYSTETTEDDPESSYEDEDNGLDGSDDPTSDGVSSGVVTLVPRNEPIDDIAADQPSGYRDSSANTTVDLGFVGFDLGDLPDTYNNTTFTGSPLGSGGEDGARHLVWPAGTSGRLLLGTTVDVELDGQESGDTSGDDSGGSDDEDGVDLGITWERGWDATIDVTVSGSGGYLVAWFDWNGDGDFLDVDEEHVYGNVAPGVNALTVAVPGSAVDTVSIRFRLYAGDPGSPSPTGWAVNGEVEDYQHDTENPTAVTLASFTAEWDGGQVLVAWETALEIDTVGFNVWRSTNPDDGYVQVNAALIPAESLGGVEGGFYEIVDTNVTPGTTYHYKLEEVEVGGARSWYGPVSTGGSVPAVVRVSATAVENQNVVLVWVVLAATVALTSVVLVRRRRLRG